MSTTTLSKRDQRTLKVALEALKITGLQICKAIEASGMSCRVYTRNRGYATAVAAFVPLVGWAALGHPITHKSAEHSCNAEKGHNPLKN